MVSFSCEVCQDTIKKPKLDNHRAKCRAAYFTCLDCNKTFQVDFVLWELYANGQGTEYRNHNSCISEAERYQKGLYKPNKKQQNQHDAQNHTSQPEPVKEELGSGSKRKASANQDAQTKPKKTREEVTVADFVSSLGADQVKLDRALRAYIKQHALSKSTSKHLKKSLWKSIRASKSGSKTKLEFEY